MALASLLPWLLAPDALTLLPCSTDSCNAVTLESQATDCRSALDRSAASMDQAKAQLQTQLTALTTEHDRVKAEIAEAHVQAEAARAAKDALDAEVEELRRKVQLVSRTVDAGVSWPDVHSSPLLCPETNGTLQDKLAEASQKLDTQQDETKHALSALSGAQVGCGSALACVRLASQHGPEPASSLPSFPSLHASLHLTLPETRDINGTAMCRSAAARGDAGAAARGADTVVQQRSHPPGSRQRACCRAGSPLQA